MNKKPYAIILSMYDYSNEPFTTYVYSEKELEEFMRQEDEYQQDTGCTYWIYRSKLSR